MFGAPTWESGRTAADTVAAGGYPNVPLIVRAATARPIVSVRLSARAAFILHPPCRVGPSQSATERRLPTVAPS